MRFILIAIFFAGTLGGLCSVLESDWEKLGERVDLAREEFEEAGESREKDQEEFREEAIAYLRSLMLYESAVRILATPEDEVTGLDQTRGFSSQECRSIQKLRQEIRDADRERLLSALGNDADLAADEKAAESILKDELRLDSLYQKKTRKLAGAITKLERQLGKLQNQKIRNDSAREKVKAEIKVLKEKIANTHRAVYGFRYGAGFYESAPEGLQEPVAGLLAKIILEREKVLSQLKGKQSDADTKGGQAGTVGGSFLYSSNLGVVLDVSGSMTKHLKELRDEINSYFEAPRYREVEGCRLDSCHFESVRTKRRPSTWATMSVIEELITVRAVDTVYWFSDLQDDQDYSSIRRLRELLMRGGTRLHVKSLGKKPSRELDDILTDFQD